MNLLAMTFPERVICVWIWEAVVVGTSAGTTGVAVSTDGAMTESQPEKGNIEANLKAYNNTELERWSLKRERRWLYKEKCDYDKRYMSTCHLSTKPPELKTIFSPNRNSAHGSTRG